MNIYGWKLLRFYVFTAAAPLWFYVYTYLCIYIHKYLRKEIFTALQLYGFMYIHIYVYMYLWVPINTDLCKTVYTQICIYSRRKQLPIKDIMLTYNIYMIPL
jgi:hypothetical protein